MKKTIIYATLALAAMAVCSCKEDKLKVYNGENYVHFQPNSSDKVEASYNFSLGKTTREEEVKVAVPIRLWGYLPERDFECRVSVVDSITTALPSDYVKPTVAIFRKGNPVDTLFVTVKRRPKLLETDYILSIHMDSAGDGHVVAPAKYLTVRISVTDKIVVKPIWWETVTDAVGKYSDIKFRLFNYYLGKYLNQLDEYTSITFKQEALKFRAWLKEKFESGEFVYYDEDGVTPLYKTIPEA